MIDVTTLPKKKKSKKNEKKVPFKKFPPGSFEKNLNPFSGRVGEKANVKGTSMSPYGIYRVRHQPRNQNWTPSR